MIGYLILYNIGGGNSLILIILNLANSLVRVGFFYNMIVKKYSSLSCDLYFKSRLVTYFVQIFLFGISLFIFYYFTFKKSILEIADGFLKDQNENKNVKAYVVIKQTLPIVFFIIFDFYMAFILREHRNLMRRVNKKYNNDIKINRTHPFKSL
jgi:hypothetical protein